jgi:membrane associated rhomboid family serine protease
LTNSYSTALAQRRRGPSVLDGILFFALFLGLLWGLEALDVYVLSQNLNAYGIAPRSRDGLIGIVAAPFLHAGFDHLWANTLPLAVLGVLIFVRGAGRFATVTLVVIALGGLGVWLVGDTHSMHIGASGLVFGYLGFLLAAGLYERSAAAIAVSLVVGVLYGGALWGVLPGQPGVSWEGHLFGFVAGVVSARALSSGRARR